MFKSYIRFGLFILLTIAYSCCLAQPKYLKIYYPDDTLSAEIMYKQRDSLETGKLKAFFKESPEILAYEKHYYGGKQSGVYKAYYPSGRLMILAIYRYGERHGDWTYYGTDGEIDQKAKYREGKLHGFYINREKHFQGRYRNGLKHGKWEYNVGTAAYRKVFYENGKLSSKPSVFDKMKDLVNLGETDSTQLNKEKLGKNEFKKFDTLSLPYKDSVKRFRVRYISADSIDHPSLRKAVYVHDPNQIAVVSYVYQGNLNGIYKIYYPNGNVYRYIHYDSGKLDGEWKEYDSSGQLRIRGNYRDGKKHGNWMIDIGTEYYRKEKYKEGRLKE